MLDSKEAINVYYVFAVGFRAVLERCWLGSLLDLPGLVRCRLGFGFRFLFCFTSLTLATAKVELLIHFCWASGQICCWIRKVDPGIRYRVAGSWMNV